MPDYKRMAGEKQESQVSYFLDRYFGSNDNYRILNNLEIEVNGFKSQIDHLIIYKAGFIVVESKSIQGAVRVNSLGEWERSYKDEWFGIPSPVQQAAVQIDNLKALLRENDSQLLGKLLGLQKGFGGRQYKTVIAISSSARLDRDNIPADISQHIVKTEFLVDKIKDLTKAANNGLKSFAKTEARFTDDEMDRIYAFLKSYQRAGEPALKQEAKPAVKHSEVQAAPVEGPVTVSCKKCGETEALSAQYGRFGYYVQCAKCSTNTALKHTCPACGSGSTRTRKSKSDMYLDCQSCNKSTPFAVKWGAAASS
ncbi:nuclease-related domain-containing protein [Marinobacter sp. ANT_B65]|uniref:nuclease-related domain-containing protein n=1 Tax=Marinobacter sp. ANT_B65 TaxID=2039467 RepID=UPI000BBF1204|nr:nuclease-related domain-containing protein [Marinobacter sp. ANT_B65]PCM44893.1 NERD domain-containing protein [Marinobacter sp. ANT_B65]